MNQNDLFNVNGLITGFDSLIVEWHEGGDPEPRGGAALMDVIRGLHGRNFQLWHTEDDARMVNVDDSIIANCKRRIDKLNQSRQDHIERVDEGIIAAWPWAVIESQLPMNTETPGSAVDRLSIASLKICHMKEQTERTDVSKEHIEKCSEKFMTLLTQRSDLAEALEALLDDIKNRRKRMKVYRQFKMYNDPSLNPSVYGKNK